MSIFKKLRPKLPSKVRVTAKHSYEIVYIEKFPDEKTLGECRPEPHRQIVISKQQSDSEIVSSLIHEWIHALSFEYHIGLTEAQVIKLEKAVFKAFRLNKIFEFILRIL